ncbi:MAG TPA: hydroxyisourate hydrolase [Candidatus Xenobia bacterium]|jgi:5-hydroxyisourate hydrolase
MSGITTHVLDTSKGRPAAGVAVLLERLEGSWKELSRKTTDADGRVKDLLRDPLQTGKYRLTFDTGAWLASQGTQGFFPEVAITFEIHDAASHYHVPLLLSPFGYSTYRGS